MRVRESRNCPYFLLRGGFSLVEVMLAVLLLGIGIVGISILLGGGAASGEASKQRLVALALAQRQMEEALAIPYASLATGEVDLATIPGYPGLSSRVEVSQEFPTVKGVAVTYFYPEGEVRLFGYRATY